jgi:hypothetical protein
MGNLLLVINKMFSFVMSDSLFFIGLTSSLKKRYYTRCTLLFIYCLFFICVHVPFGVVCNVCSKIYCFMVARLAHFHKGVCQKFATLMVHKWVNTVYHQYGEYQYKCGSQMAKTPKIFSKINGVH